MTTLRFLFLFFIGLGMSAFAQNQRIDSLKKILDTEQSDVDRAILFNEIADLYKSENPVYTKEFAEKALVLSIKNGQKREEGRAYINLGNYSIISGDYASALDYFRQAKELFEENSPSKHTKELARVYGSIGIVFSEQSNYSKALEYHLKALKIYGNENDKQTLSRIYNNIGIVYKAQKENAEALAYFTKTQELQDSLNDPAIGITSTNIGNVYLEQENYPKAFEYYQKAENEFQKYPNPRGLGELYNNLGLYYQQTGKELQAVASWDKAIASFKSIGDKFGVSDTYFFLGRFYFSNQDYKNAIEYTEMANSLAKELSLLEMLALSEKQLRDIYEASGNYRLALQHGKTYDEYKDSLVNYRDIRNSVQAEMDFEFEKKEALHKAQQ